MWNCSTLFGLGGMGGFHPWGGIFHLIFWGALILFVIWAVKQVTRPERGPSTRLGCEAASILDTRFARGDLSAEEYRQAKRTLKNG